MNASTLTPDSFMAQEKGALTPDSFMAQQAQSSSDLPANVMTEDPRAAVGNTLMREVGAAGKAIAGIPGSVYHAFADDPQTDEEQKTLAEHPVVGRAAMGLGRMVVDPIKNAAQWYGEAAEGKVPNAYEQALSVAPEAVGTGAAAPLTDRFVEAAPRVVPPVVRGIAKGANAVLEKAPGTIGGAAGAAIGHATGVPGAAEVGGAVGYGVGREVLPKLKVPGENFGLPNKVPPAPTGEPVGPPSPPPELVKSTALANAETPAALPRSQTGEALGTIKRGQISSAINSPVRTLPGQISPEVVQPLTSQPAAPIPPRQGLALRAAPKGAELSEIPGTDEKPAAQTGEALGGPPPRGNTPQAVRTPETTPAAQQSASPPPQPPPTISRGSIKQMMDAMQSQLTERQMGAIAKKLDPSLQGDPYANLPHKMTPVDSSAISKIGYDPASQSMAVEWKNGTVYHHPDVPPEAYDAFANAESQGKHFSANMRNQYPGTLKGFAKTTGRGAIAAAMTRNP